MNLAEAEETYSQIKIGNFFLIPPLPCIYPFLLTIGVDHGVFAAFPAFKVLFLVPVKHLSFGARAYINNVCTALT